MCTREEFQPSNLQILLFESTLKSLKIIEVQLINLQISLEWKYIEEFECI